MLHADLSRDTSHLVQPDTEQHRRETPVLKTVHHIFASLNLLVWLLNNIVGLVFVAQIAVDQRFSMPSFALVVASFNFMNHSFFYHGLNFFTEAFLRPRVRAFWSLALP